MSRIYLTSVSKNIFILPYCSYYIAIVTYRLCYQLFINVSLWCYHVKLSSVKRHYRQPTSFSFFPPNGELFLHARHLTPSNSSCIFPYFFMIYQSYQKSNCLDLITNPTILYILYEVTKTDRTGIFDARLKYCAGTLGEQRSWKCREIDIIFEAECVVHSVCSCSCVNIRKNSTPAHNSSPRIVNFGA